MECVFGALVSYGQALNDSVVPSLAGRPLEASSDLISSHLLAARGASHAGASSTRGKTQGHGIRTSLFRTW